MSVLYSDVMKRVDAGKKVSALDVQAPVYLATARYVVTGTEAVGDVIELCPLPREARVVPSLSSIWSEGVGTGLSVKCGDGADDARFAPATAVQAAGVYALKGGTGEAGSNVASGTVRLTITAASALTAGKAIKVYVAYVCP